MTPISRAQATPIQVETEQAATSPTPPPYYVKPDANGFYLSLCGTLQPSGLEIVVARVEAEETLGGPAQAVLLVRAANAHADLVRVVGDLVEICEGDVNVSQAVDVVEAAKRVLCRLKEGFYDAPEPAGA